MRNGDAPLQLIHNWHKFINNKFQNLRRELK